MDYSPTRRIALTLLISLLALALPGCPEANQPSDTSSLASPQDLYRQARTIEDRVASSPAEAAANLQQARTIYIRALAAGPSSDLDAYIRAGLANVAFFQDDYKTAIDQWSASSDRITDPQLKSMLLLRLGTAQQRLGLFDQADRTFMTLQEQFPQSEASRVARPKYGARQFYVQLAVFSQPTLAEKAITQLHKQGFSVAHSTDSQNRQVISVGPYRTYPEAQFAKSRLTSEYQSSFIQP
ncbi:MAG TPA: SPOR domain-containing protein [Tepidisphaeraceae bacterium]|jgi:tetratricopeptide (TPR) repeat protein|nr:SPOR domain-containing protein [Tepidisphaeraceae bacterium]